MPLGAVRGAGRSWAVGLLGWCCQEIQSFSVFTCPCLLRGEVTAQPSAPGGGGVLEEPAEQPGGGCTHTAQHWMLGFRCGGVGEAACLGW